MDSPAPPVAESAPPVAEFLGLLSHPPPDQVREARIRAGHTLRQAAAVIGSPRPSTWAEYEADRRNIPAPIWTWYLLATDQHPTLELRQVEHRIDPL